MVDREGHGAIPESRSVIYCLAMRTIVIVVLLLVVVGALPTWGHSRSWGYGPSGIGGLILVVLLILFLMGRL